MRKFFLLLLILGFSNCGTTKPNNSEKQDWINAQNFTLVKPNNWRTVKDHDYVSYTSLKERDKFFYNVVSVVQFQIKEKKDFKEFVMDQIKKANGALNISSEKISESDDYFDQAYIHQSESTWHGEKYKKYTMYFAYNDEYYFYNYSSRKDLYDQHFDEAISMLNSIVFE